MIRSAVFTAIMLAALPASAEPDLLRPATLPFHEQLSHRVQVGGHVLMGVVVTPGGELTTGIGLGPGKLNLQQAPATAICVQVATQDGQYSAANTYEAGPTGRLAWPTAYPDALASIPLRQIATLVTGGPCGGRASKVIPVEVGPGAVPQPAFVQVLANSQGAATWATLRDPAVGGPALRRVRCSRIEDGSRVAFDVQCPLGLLPGNAELELRIEQQGRDGRSMEVVERVMLSPSAPPTP